MPEVTASTKIVLGSVAAAAALITGLLGNVLAANISAFFSGTPPKAGKRPAILWLAFFVSASLSVVAGSITTFAPTAPASPSATSVSGPKVLVTNVSGSMLAQNTRSLLIVCRDTLQIANTSGIPTSVVAAGTEVNVDGTLLKVNPRDRAGTASAGGVSLAVSPWKTAPDTKAYGNLKTLQQFVTVLGVSLPIRSGAHSTAAVYIDYALQFASALPRSISAVHVLRFPDLKDLQTRSIKCQ
jgi:hypothetical protein